MVQASIWAMVTVGSVPVTFDPGAHAAVSGKPRRRIKPEIWPSIGAKPEPERNKRVMAKQSVKVVQRPTLRADDRNGSKA
ncbi:hypothetical protein GCM10007854_19340 [Algimonas porphyrae]|uniref:Uncharacterized protein n=1 Tax=Algimonas porphyrae TaxID=1128113 RepID=A0ABQ5V212_9PROT|nr:hypothetical protein GCM10007854_19340 [Algimonas porphyrae]